MLGGFGWEEGLVLMLIGLVVIGPDRLPGVAQEAGKSLRRLRLWLKGMTDDLTTELGPEVGDLDLRSLHPREFLRKNLFEDEERPPVRGRRGALLGPGEPVPWDPDTT